MDKKSLNPAQLQAVHHPAGPLLIIAGAGTGKTATLTHRLVHLIETGTEPQNICALTFTNKAAKEMLSRATAELATQNIHLTLTPWIGTFHGFGASILRREARLLGRTAAFSIFDDGDSAQAIRKILKDRGPIKEHGPAYYKNEISRAKDGLSHPELDAQEIAEAYEQILLTVNAFDFGDLIQKVVFLFRKYPHILARYQEKFSCFLIDEYQDTNAAQRELIRLLAKDSQNLSVVGDDQQTIYTWRGSDVRAFLDFPKEWPGTHVVILDQNYRSTGNILSAASAVIALNELQQPKVLWTEGGVGDKVRIAEFLDEEQEARWVAEDIQKKPPSEKNTIGILYRVNAQSRAIESALLDRGLAYRIFGGVRFYERREIKDILAGMRLLVNPGDILSRERLERELTKRKTAKLVTALINDPPKTTDAFIHLFLEQMEYSDYLERNFGDARERKENIVELIRAARETPDLSAFLERIALLSGSDFGEKKGTPESLGDLVHLTTIHLAKGLEFDRVFIIGCADGNLPHQWSMGSLDELEEERRLMYVAMTRARKELTITFSGVPSRFLENIPAETSVYENLLGEEDYITLD